MNRVAVAFVFSALLPVFLSTVFMSSSEALASTLQFTDSGHHEWQRWVLTEKQTNRVLLLVVEKPLHEAEAVSQRVVYRQSFARDSAELHQQIKRFENLDDRRETGFRFVADPAGETLTAAAPSAHQPIWTLKQNFWTLQDERNYTAWIRDTVTDQFLKGSGLIVDCADLSLTLRWIYAHDHGLPAANSLGGSGGLFGQWSGTAAWDHLATNGDWRRDARFKTALRYLLNSAYTHTIQGDLYPTEISREYVTPGAIRLTITDVESGHTQVIHHVGHDEKLCPDGQCVSVFYGDTPASETIYNDVAWLLNLKRGDGGFLRWRWPVLSAAGVWSLTTATSMPGYSLEQFSHPSFTRDQYENYINTDLFWSTTVTDRAVTLGYSMIQALQARVEVTTRAYVFCYLAGCQPGSSAYGDYATTDRDQRFIDSQARFLDLLVNDAVDTTAASYQSFLQTSQAPIFSGGGLAYADYIFNSQGLSASLSSDASRSFTERWGLRNAAADAVQWANEGLWEKLWTYRDAQVASAQKLCYANGSATLTCHAGDAAVRALSTSDLDRALRHLRLTLRAQFEKIDAPTQTQMITWTQQETTAETGQGFCAKTPSGRCAISDFIYSPLSAVPRMTSVATDTLTQRFGF